MLIAIAIGVIQVLLGLGLGIYNGIRTKHWDHVYEKGGMFAFVVGFIVLLLGFTMAAWLQSTALWIQALGGLALFLGFAFAIKGGKMLGAIESISALANIASYLRIMAVGLAGAIFANAANGIAMKSGNPVLGIIIVVPLQAFGFIIAAFSPNIHAVRLNFLEFFGKFYESGSKDYKPFQKTGGENKA
jgi:V/A-type H+-transporting ATPase subunit I